MDNCILACKTQNINLLHYHFAPEYLCIQHHGQYLIHLCCISNFIKGVLFLLDKNADINQLNIRQETPIVIACVHDFEELAHILMDFNPNIDIPDISGNTLLHHLSNSCLTDVFQYACHNTQNVNHQNHRGKSPLHLCTENTSFVDSLIQANANVNIIDNNGNTPLHSHLSYFGCITIVKLFLDSGSDFNIVNNLGNLPLHLAITNSCNLNVIFLIIDNTSNISISNYLLFTPLNYAIIHKSDAINYLIENGADVHFIDGKGQNIIQSFVFYCPSLFSCLHTLLNKQCNPFLLSSNNTSAFDIIISTQNNSYLRIISKLCSVDIYSNVSFSSINLSQQMILSHFRHVKRKQSSFVCSICMEDVSDSYEQNSNCSHFYHKSCIFKWLKKNSTCPQCRSPWSIHSYAFLAI